MKKNIVLIVLGAIFALGLLLRALYLDKYPPALSWDEISHGYNAYSILKTGSDEWGQKIPIINFRAYGDYPLPLNLYITIPSILLFGLNEFSIRLPHAILGVLTIVATYFLVMGITKKRGISILASFLVAVEPWTLFTSRIVLQQNLSVFLLTSCAAAFFNRDKSKVLLPTSFVLLFLTLFAYHSTRIFSPLVLLTALIVNRNEFRSLLKKGMYLAVVAISAVVAFFVLTGVILQEPSARARAKWLFIINEGAIASIEESRQNSSFPAPFPRLIYNRPTYFIYQFSRNYLEYLSPQFLFLSGGTQYQYSLPGKGLSYFINLPFFYLGVFILLKKALKGSKDYQFLLVWLALSPIPGSITSEHFAVTRASVMLPLPQIASSLGAFWVFDYLNKKFSGRYRYFLIALYVGGVFLLSEDYLANYFTTYTKNYSEAWQFGYKEAVNYAKNSYSKYDKIIITKKYGEPHEFVLFFWPWDPQEYRDDPNLIRFYQSNWYWVDGFDKFYFVNDWQVPAAYNEDFVLESGRRVGCLPRDEVLRGQMPPQSSSAAGQANAKCLFITSPGNVPDGWTKLKTINFLDGRPAFEIYDNLNDLLI